MPILTLIAGGGWFISYRAYKRKANGEAMQSEAEGWKTQQQVYQSTIHDLHETCDFIRKDRDILRKENEELRKENAELRSTILKFEAQIAELRVTIARQGRRIEALTNKNKKTKKDDGNIA